MATVKVQLLLRPGCRNESGATRATAAATAMGFRVTSTGRVTLSAEVDEAQFAALFGAEVRAIAARKGSNGDFGAPAGFVPPDESLPVPAPLAELVESIGVAAPYARLR